MWTVVLLPTIFVIGMIFIVIGVAKNKQGEFIKKSAFSAIVISMLFSMFLLSINKVHTFFYLSMIIAFISLIVYLFSDYQD